MADRAVIYLRQSTFREESISLELQEEACRAHARREQYRVVAVEQDPGVSGRTFDRPGVQAVLDMVEHREADVILLWKWSRWSRNRLDWYVAADRAQQAGGRIESATEPIDTSTSIGRLSRGMLIEIAAFESERAGDQWKEALERRIRNGLPHDGKPRFGYDYAAKKYTVDPVTGPVLADLYRRYVAGESFSALAQWLNAAGHPTTRATMWTQNIVKRLLDTGFGAGIIRYRGQVHPGIHEPVIDDAVWAAYQQARARRATRPRAERSRYLLSGIVRCRTCDRPLSGWTHAAKRIAYYRCDMGAQLKVHATHHIRVEAVEDEVKRVIAEIADEVEGMINPGTPVPAVDLDVLREDVARRRQALATLTVRNIDGAITDDAYAATAPALQARLTAAQEALQRAEAAPALPAPTADTAGRLLADWDQLPVTARREGVRGLVGVVWVDFAAGKTVMVGDR